MKQSVNVFDYTNEICNALKKGILLTTRADGKTNTMTIGWGHIGIEWGRTIFVAYIRESRYTRELVDASGSFTVNIPMKDVDPQILRICGTKSGRDTDKITLAGLTSVESNQVSAPGFLEFPLTLECKVLYRRLQDLSLVPQDILDRYYPQEIDGSNPGKNRDAHFVYYGEIVDAYILS